MNNTNNIPSRRSVKDRRQKSTPPFSIYSIFGSRMKNRRTEDGQKNYYVDRYRIRALITVYLIMTLCLVDSYITLFLLDHGAKEVNPFMAVLLRFGPVVFLTVKYAFSGICILVLLMHKNFYVFNEKINIKVFAVLIIFAYLILVLYEIFLINNLAGRLGL